MKKRILSLLLCLLLCLMLLPMTVSAADIASGTGWRLDSAGCLHLTGAITNPSKPNDVQTPWKDYSKSIKSVVAAKGSSIDSCYAMFHLCASITSVDLRYLDTSKVTKMNSMFSYCSDLTSVKLQGIDTGNVTSMESMFSYCYKLTSVDVSTFNTSNVESTFGMFSGCKRLASVDLGNFKTPKLKFMGSMFKDCSELKSVDLSMFDTSNVTSMLSLFSGCTALTSVNLKGLNTEKLSDMGYMFKNCSSLKTLDLSDLDTATVKYSNDVFTGCTALTSVTMTSDLVSRTAEQLEAIRYNWIDAISGKALYGTTDLKRLTGTVRLVEPYWLGDVWNIDAEGCLHITGAVQNPAQYNDISPWKEHKSAIKSVMAHTGSSIDCGLFLFYNCENLLTADLRQLDTSKATSFDYMFTNSPALMAVDLRGLKTSNITGMKSTFMQCSSLQSLQLDGCDFSKLGNLSYCFFECKALEKLDLSGHGIPDTCYSGTVFYHCDSLKELKVNATIAGNNAYWLVSVYPNWIDFGSGVICEDEASFEKLSGMAELYRFDCTTRSDLKLYPSISLEDKIIFTALTDAAAEAEYDKVFVTFDNVNEIDDRMSNHGSSLGASYGSKYRIYQFPIYVCQMTDPIEANIYAVKDGKVYKGIPSTMSVREFVLAAMPGMSQAMKTMCANLLQYGAAMQCYFEYRTYNLPNYDLGSYADLIVHTVPVAENKFSTTNKGLTDVTLYNRALSIGSVVQMQYAFKLNKGTVNDIYVKLTVDGKTTRYEGSELTVSGKYAALIFEDLLPTQADSPITITVYDKTTNKAVSETITDTLTSAVAGYQTASNSSLRNAVNAMLNYYRLAKTAFGK